MKVNRSTERKHAYPNGKSGDTYPYSETAIIFKTDQLELFSEKLSPGRKASAPHKHREIDEIIYVLKGSVDAREGDKILKLDPGDSVCFSANSNQNHFLENNYDLTVEYLIIRKNIHKSDVIY